MRKILLAATLACTLGFGGCATIQAITSSTTNPVTPERLYQVENAMIVAVAGLNAYRQSCLKGVADVNCRKNIAAIQVYTRRIPPLLTQARTFVRNNDQVNAIVVYNQIMTLIANFKSTAAAAGVPIGG